MEEKVEDGVMKEVAFKLDLGRIKGLCKQKTKERCSRLWDNQGHGQGRSPWHL